MALDLGNSETHQNFLVSFDKKDGIIQSENPTVEVVNPDIPQHRELEIDKYSGELLPIEHWDKIRRNTVDAIASNERIQAIATFDVFAQNINYTITDKEIEELTGVTPSRTGWIWDAFQFTRCSQIKTKNGKQRTWIVARTNPTQERMKKSLSRTQKKRSRKKNLDTRSLSVHLNGQAKVR